MFLAFATSSRASGIHRRHIVFLVNTGYKVTFHFHKLHESWRKVNPPRYLAVYAYSADKQLCVVQTLNRCLEMMKDRRDPPEHNFFRAIENPIKKLLVALLQVGLIKF